MKNNPGHYRTFPSVRRYIMNIIIVGFGVTGAKLAENLTREGHDVSVIDTNPADVRKATEAFDVLGIVGNGATHKVQMEAGVAEADLFIAVTPHDELNLLCCLIAKKNSDCATIARVRNPDYLSERGFIKDKLGLSSIINPEYESAAEINRLFCIPSAISVDTFARGKVELLRMGLPKGSPIAGSSIVGALGKLSGKMLICAVERNGEITIPTGSFVLREGDEISFITSHSDAENFFKKAGLDTDKIKRVLIAGGGTISYYLISMLLEYGFRVKVIEKDRKRCEHLSEIFPSSVSIINGDWSDQQLLFEEGIDRVDGFAALTDNDEENIMLSLFAGKHSKAKLVTKVNKNSFDDVLGDLGIGSVISPKTITSEMILSHARALNNSQGSNVQTMYSIVGGKVEALEFYARTESTVTGIPLSDLEIKDGILICCISRNGKTIIPNGMTKIEKGDTVIVVTTQSGLNDLTDIVK